MALQKINHQLQLLNNNWKIGVRLCLECLQGREGSRVFFIIFLMALDFIYNNYCIRDGGFNFIVIHYIPS